MIDMPEVMLQNWLYSRRDIHDAAELCAGNSRGQKQDDELPLVRGIISDVHDLHSVQFFPVIWKAYFYLIYAVV